MSKSSRQLFAEARRHLVGGVNSPVRAFRAVGGNPPFVVSARGAWLRTADGRRLLDFVGGWGPHLLGHAHPAVIGAARRATSRGTGFGLPGEIETRLAARIKRALPSIERLRLVNSGTEATMSAIRLARAATGRDLVVKFDGGYHGHADGLLASAGSGLATLGIPSSPGVPRSFARLTLTVPFNDPSALRSLFGARGRRIAAVIAEPVMGNMGVIPPERGFLGLLRGITRRNGALLIFDEVMTGFRVAWGGMQRAADVDPDLTCLGKIVGGGFPVGAYGGRRRLMRLVAPEGSVYQAGTLSGNPVAAAAGLAALERLSRMDYGRLARRTAWFCRALRREAALAGVPVWVGEACGMFTVFFTSRRVSDARSARTSSPRRFAAFFRSMLDQGVLFPPSQFEAVFLGFAHTPRDLDRALVAARRAFRAAALTR